VTVLDTADTTDFAPSKLRVILPQMPAIALLAVGVDRLNTKPTPKQAPQNMPGVTMTNVEHYYDQPYVPPETFTDELPAFLRKNLAGGDYAFQ
jgi:hypothetical protein